MNLTGLEIASLACWHLLQMEEFCFLASFTIRIREESRAQRLINLEIPVLVRSLKSSNVELG